MSPRSLTDSEKEKQRQILIQKGLNLLISYGLRRISIEDITKAAGIAKGTFYLYFASKESFLLIILKELHERILSQVERIFLESEPVNLRERLRQFTKDLFSLPEILFFMKNHEELDRLFVGELHDQVQSIKEWEYATYDRILKQLFGAEIKKVKAGVVFNYIHAIYKGVYGNDVMINEYITETIDILIEGLVQYVINGIQ